MLGEGHSTSGAGPSDAPAPPPEAANWLHCPVCLSLILPDRKPTLVKPCDHMFCQECIAGAQARKRKADQKCPSCRGKIVETAALAASAGLHRVYLAEKVPCPYDCGTAVEISGLEGHYGKCEKLKCAYCGLAVIPPMTQEVSQIALCFPISRLMDNLRDMTPQCARKARFFVTLRAVQSRSSEWSSGHTAKSVQSG